MALVVFLAIILIVIVIWSYCRGKKDIENDNYIPTMEEIGNADDEKENNGEYKFNVSFETILGKWFSISTTFKTKINVEDNILRYNLNRKCWDSSGYFKRGDRKYNTFTEGAQYIDIDDILSIKYKIGFSFASSFFDFSAFLCVVIEIVFLIMNQLYFGIILYSDLEKIPIHFNYILNIMLFFLFIYSIRYFTCKCIEIKYRTTEGIKKIIFPIRRAFSFLAATSIKKTVNSFVEEIKQKNHNIKMKKNSLKWIFICYIIIAFIIYFFVPIYLMKNF